MRMRRELSLVISIAVILLVVAPVSQARTETIRCGTDGAYGVEDEPGNAPRPDPLFDKQWALQQMDVPEAWELHETGKHVTIALVDTGVDLTHPDLDANLLEGVDLLPELGECPGPQAEEVDPGVYENHGTTTAGVMVAEAKNGIGISGVAPDAQVLPIRAIKVDQFPFYPLLESAGAQRVAEAIDYAVLNEADVILLEVALSPVLDPDSEQLVAAALKRAWDAGAVIVAPAVNASVGTCFYPASDPHALCVAATDHLGRPTWYSDVPVSQSHTNAVRAPGGFGWEGLLGGPEFLAGRLGIPFPTDMHWCNSENIWTTIAGVEGWGCEGASFDTFSGTSYSAAHVAGVAALLVGAGASNAEIIECLTSTAYNPVTDDRGYYDPVYGYGIVDADDALRACEG